MIRLAPITPENYRECLRLQVAESQARYVASNAKALAEAYVYYDTSRPYAIYADEQMVGFLLLRHLDNLHCYYLSQFMIGERFQRRGYGRQAMIVLLDLLRVEKRYGRVDLCYVEGDEAARRLYAGLGFAPTGDAEAGEIVMALAIQ